MLVAAQGITIIQRLVPLVAAALIAGMTVELIRRRKLREEYAMLWITASVVLVVFAVVPHLLFWLSMAIGVYYITIMVIIMFSFLSLLIIHLSMSASKTEDDTRKIAQRTAVLEEKLERLEKRAGPSGSVDDDSEKPSPPRIST